MSERTSDIPPAVAALLEDERSACVPPGAKAAVLSRLEASLPGLRAAFDAPDAADVGATDAPGGAAAIDGAGRLSILGAPSWVRAIGLLALGGVGGFALHGFVATPEVVYVERTPVPASSASISPAPPDLPEPATAVSSLPSVVESEPAAKTVQSGSSLDRETTLAVERALLDRARNALMRGEAAEADGILREHERRFGRGELREERDALIIKALARTGRVEEARTRAERFRSDYPHSLLLMGIDAELR